MQEHDDQAELEALELLDREAGETMQEKQSEQGREVVHDPLQLGLESEPPKVRVKPKPDAPMVITPPAARFGVG